VTDLLGSLAPGAAYKEILADYPFLEPDNIYAALEQAALQTSRPVLKSF
jgi:uncharacterized protein (DUF433 family)